MRRLRALTEAECYARCYGGRERDVRVRVVRLEPRRARFPVLASGELVRQQFEELLDALAPQDQQAALEYGIGLTNAAYRTTPGSGDLRRGDFVGAAERLERLAHELRPRWIAFVGKEAYRGAFNERPELGVQERRLGETRLFVLPSASPANAAVPWE